MPAPPKYAPWPAEIVRAGRRARAEGLTFSQFWAQRVMTSSPVCTTVWAAPDDPRVRWPRTTKDRKEARTLAAETQWAWRRAYERWPISKGERALAKLGDVPAFVPVVPLKVRALDVLAASSTPLTAAALARRIRATESSVVSVAGGLIADLAVSTPPRRPHEARRFVAVPPGTPGDTPEAVREAIFGERVEVVSIGLLIARALADGPMTIADLGASLRVDGQQLRTALSGMVKGGRLLRSTPGQTGRRHGGQVIVALPQHGDRIRARPAEAVAA